MSLYYDRTPYTLGIRCNNPFNIRYSSAKWEGKIAHKGNFELFSDMDHGVRAGVILLRNYIRSIKDPVSGVPINTLSRIINRFAPMADGNDTERYISYVIKHLETRFHRSFSRDYVFTYPSPEFAALCVAIMWFESMYLVPDSHIYYIINKFKIY